MSIQTDCEMLSLSALESYALRHDITSEAATEIFHTNQVFENILLQHEYLHQVSTREVDEYVERLITDGAKELVVYHGSCFDFDAIDLSKSHDRRDFGMGFYTTVIRRQSEEWGYRLALRRKTNAYYVYSYLFREDSGLRVKRFDSLSAEWLEFVKENRINGGIQHNYDVVIGPVADDNTMETVQLYIAGVYTPDEAVERLRHFNVNNQVSFHTKEALEHLKPIGRELYDNLLHV